MDSSLTFKRIGGWIIDLILIVVVSVHIARYSYSRLHFSFFLTYFAIMALLIAASMVLAVISMAFLAYFFHGATVGMILFGLRTRTENGSRVRLSQMLIRELLFLTPQIVIVNAVYMFSQQTNRSLSDLMTNTYVTTSHTR